MNCRRSFFTDVISPSSALSIWPEGDKEQKLRPVNFQRDANNPSLQFNPPRVEEKNWQTEVGFSLWQRQLSPHFATQMLLSVLKWSWWKRSRRVSWFWLLTTLAQIRNKIKMKPLYEIILNTPTLLVFDNHMPRAKISVKVAHFAPPARIDFLCWVTQVRWLTPDFWVRSKSCIQDCSHERMFH